MSQEYKYVARISADTSELEKVLSKAQGKLQRLSEDEVLIKLDYDGNIAAFNKTFNKMLKAAPELTIQFQYDVNKKILDQEINKLQQLTDLKLTIDEGSATAKVKSMLADLDKAYFNDAKESELYSRIDNIIRYANTISGLGAKLDNSWLTEIENYADAGKSINDLLQKNAEKPLKLFELDSSLDDSIEKTQKRINEFQDVLESLKKKGASELSETSEFKELSDQVKILTADIAEMKQQLGNLSGEAFDDMSESVGRLEEKLGFALQRIQELKEANVNPNNLSFHVGELEDDKFRWKSESMNRVIQNMNWGNFGRKEKGGIGLGYGILGTGVYHTPKIEEVEIGGDNPKGYALNIDPSKYNLLIRNTTKEATKLLKFLSAFQGFTIARGSGYSEWDEALKGVDVKSLYKQFVDVFGETAMDIKEFSDFVDSMLSQVSEMAKFGFDNKGNFKLSGTKWDHADTPVTQLLKKLGYEGIDLRGTYWDSYEQGSTIFDLHPEDIVKSFDSQEKMESYWEKNQKAIKEFKTDASKALGEAGESIVKLTKYVEELNEKLDMLASKVNAISDVARITSATADMTSAAVEGMQDGQHSHSPSVDGENEGDNLVDGYVGRIRERIPEARAVGEALSKSTVEGLDKDSDIQFFSDESGQLSFIEKINNAEKELAGTMDKVSESAKESTEQIEGQLSLDFSKAVEGPKKYELAIVKTTDVLNDLQESAKKAFNADIGQGSIFKINELLKDSYAKTQESLAQKNRAEEIKKSESAIRDYISEIEKATDKTDEFASSIKKAIDVSKKADAGSSIDLLGDLQENVRSDTEQARKDIERLLKSIEKFEDVQKYTSSFIDRVKQVEFELKELAEQEFISPEKVSSFQKLVKSLRESAKFDYNKNFKELSRTNFLEKISQYLTKYTGLSKSTRAEIENIALAMQKANDMGELKKLYDDFLKIKIGARQAGEETQSMFTKIGNRLDDMNSKFIAQFLSWQDLIRYARELADNVIALDSAITELRKVSDASSERLSQSFEKSSQTAMELGQSIEHVVNVTADWSRLGYDVDTAEELARVTTLFTTVGDNMSSDDASSYLISTLQGYQLAADQAEDIVDKYNQVANRFAIDTAGIGEALQRSAASFNAANTDLSESIALITATNEVVQNPESVGTLWKTLSARIRGAKTELEELGEETDAYTETTSNLRDLVKGLTNFDIMKSETEFKSIYDIILGIGEAWDDLTDVERASIGEALAGKRNANALYAVLGNLDTLKDAYKEAEEAAGSAAREQENYAKSVQYSLDRLQASIEKISYDILDSQFLKDIIEGGISILNILDKVIKELGGVRASIIALSTYLSVVKRAKIIGYLTEVGNTIKFMGGAAATTSSTLIGLKTVLTAIAQNPFSWAVIGGALAVKIFDEFTLSVKEADEKIKDTESDIETLNYEIQKLRDIDSPTNSQKKYLEALEKELSIKERILELDKKDKAEQTYQYTPAEMFDADNEYRKYLLKRTGRETSTLNGGVVYTAHESGLKILPDISLLKQYRTEMEKIDLSTTDGIRKYDEYQKKIDEITRKHSQNLSDVNRDILELQTAIDKAQSDIDNHYLEEGTQAYENAQQIIKSYSRMIEADESVIDAYERLTSINSSAISSDRVVNPVLGGIKSATDSVMANLEKGNSDLFSSSNLNSYLKTLYDISDALENGTELTKDQLTELRKYFDQLEKRFPQLKDDIVVLNEEFLQGTNVWADAIANVKKELTGLKLDELGDKFEESYSKFSVPETNKSFESAHPNESFIAESKDNLEDAIASSKKYVDELDDIYKHYNGINNISRDLIIWTDENLEKYHDFVAEQGETYEQAAEDLRGTWSTVLGSAADFDGIKIAYTQMLQTDHGLVPLTADQFGAYFDSIFNQAFDENGVFNADKFIQLDSAGSEMVINGQVEHVANMIAAAEGQHMGKIKLTADDVIAIGEPGYDDITGEDLLPGINSIFKGFSMHEVQAEALDAKHQLEELAITAEDTGYTLRDILTGIEVEISDDEFKQFESELNSLIESDKDISIAVHADIADNISTISDMFNDINTAAATVQKNFMVSFNDLANLSSIFPGILEGMTILKDGTVQLNKEIAQSAIDAAKAEADADAESAMDRLNTQATLLQAKADTYKEMAHAAAVLAGNEIDSEMTSDDARAKLSAGLAEIEQLNAQLTANEEQKQQKLVADSSQENGKVVASNWAEAWQEALENAVDFANGAVTAQENAANGEKTGALKVRGSSFSGSSGTSNETNLLAETKSALEETASTAQKVFQDLETRYLEAAAVAEKAAGAARDGIQLIKANRQFTEANLTGVKEGKAGRTTPKTLEDAKEKSSGSDKKDDYKEFIDYFERMIKVLDNSIDLLEAHLEDVVGSFAKNTLLDAEEDLIQSKMNGYSSAIDMYSQKASEALSKIPSDIAEKIQNGAVDIDEFIGESNKDVVEAIQEYEKWADKVQDCKLQLVQLKEAIRQLELDKFNNVMQDFTDQFDLRQSAGIDLISKQIDLLQEAGELIGESFYKRQQEQAQKQLQILTREQEALVNQLNEALSKGVDIGSEEWLNHIGHYKHIELLGTLYKRDNQQPSPKGKVQRLFRKEVGSKRLTAEVVCPIIG